MLLRVSDSLGKTATILGVTLLVAALLKLFLARRKNAPGPKGWPIIGSVLDLPSTFQWFKYTEWTKQYGPIVHVNLLGRSMILLGSPSIVSEFLDKHHANYSERPQLPMMVDLVGYDKLTVFMKVGPLWKEHRKNFNKLFGSKSEVEKFWAVEMFQARRFMRDLLRKPGPVHKHIHQWSASLALHIAYGYDAELDENDELVSAVWEAVRQFALLHQPGEFLVDMIPALKYIPDWFPGASFKKKARYYRQTLQCMIDLPFDRVEQQVKAGTAKQSFTADLLNADAYTKQKEHALKTCAATIFAGGATTTAGMVHAWILVMLLAPEAMKKAQEELDRVVGSDRLPHYNDREKLPYLEACMHEALRLHTLGATASMRVALHDDIVNGYFIPKGSIVQPNTWEIAHNAEMYPDPFDFVPERWLVNTPPLNPREYTFGYRRRICPGIILADASMWAAMSMFIALFNISPVEGSPTFFDHSPTGVLNGESVCHAKPFNCDIRPRSAKAEALILSLDHDV